MSQSENNSVSLDWQTITVRMKAGDTAAFADYYEAMFPIMYREAQRFSGRDESTCLDLVQDAMLKAIRCIKPIRNRKQVEAWSRAVIKSVTWDWLRKQSRYQQQQLRPDLRSSRAADADARPLPDDFDSFEITARMAWIESELQTLPTDLRSMIALRYRLGWTLSAIGARFGMKAGAVDGRIRRTIERLKQKASSEYDHES